MNDLDVHVAITDLVLTLHERGFARDAIVASLVTYVVEAAQAIEGEPTDEL